MKKWGLLILLVFFCIIPTANCEETHNWSVAPVITKAYEISSGKLYLEWQGNAPVYQVYMDGKSIVSVNVKNAIIPVKNGSHNIIVYPINEEKTADTRLDMGFNAAIINGNVGIDLAALGLDPKKLVVGTPSDSLFIDYTANPIFNTAPDKLVAETDFDDQVHLSFTDRYNADEYLIYIKAGKDVNYIRFNTASEEASPFISKTNSIVTLILDQAFLQKQGCLVPELNEKYNFSVQLRKYAINLLNGEKEITVIHESKISNGFDYTPTALWKTAPVITYASQTAEGQITLQWNHDDNDLGCEYNIYKINKTFGIKTGEELWGTTKENQAVFNDIMNGIYSVSVIPEYQGEKGNSSNEVTVEVKNDWVIAPALSCEQTDKNQVKLYWPASENVEMYHIIVYAGNSDSLLRFVDLDYSKYTEFDLPSNNASMEYVFTYGEEYNSDIGQKLKFELYGIRHAANGSEQRSASSSQTITIK